MLRGERLLRAIELAADQQDAVDGAIPRRPRPVLGEKAGDGKIRKLTSQVIGLGPPALRIPDQRVAHWHYRTEKRPDALVCCITPLTELRRTVPGGPIRWLMHLINYNGYRGRCSDGLDGGLSTQWFQVTARKSGEHPRLCSVLDQLRLDLPRVGNRITFSGGTPRRSWVSVSRAAPAT